MIHIMMDMNEHQDQRYTWGDNNGRDLYLLGVNVLVSPINHERMIGSSSKSYIGLISMRC